MRKAKILLLQRDAPGARDWPGVLRELGYDAAAAAWPRADDFAAIEASHPDLILLDAHKESAASLAQAAQDIGRRYHVPVVPLLSRLSGEPDLRWRREPGLSQQEELRQTVESALQQFACESAAQRQKDYLAALVRNLPAAVIAIDQQQRIELFTPRAAELTQWPADEALGRPLQEVLRGSDASCLQCAQACLLGQDVSALAGAAALTRRDGSVCQVEMSYSAMLREDGHISGAIIMLRPAPAASAAAARAELLEGMLAAVPVPVVATDRQGKVAYSTPAARQSFAIEPDELLSQSLRRARVPKIARQMLQEQQRTVLRTGEPVQGQAAVRTAEGARRVEYTLGAGRDGQGQVQWLVYTICDISQRKRMEREILHVSEHERARLAQELHDGLNQHLLGISLFASALKQKLRERAPAESEEARRIAELACSTIEEARRLARGLCPLPLEQATLGAAMESLAKDAQELFKIRCQQSCDPQMRLLDRDTATQIYRVAQEALTNAVKHGKAKEVGIELRSVPGGGRLSIEDDGCGIGDMDQHIQGLGMRLMQYRASSIGGKLTVQKRLPQGTRVLLAFSLELEQSAEGAISGLERRG